MPYPSPGLLVEKLIVADLKFSVWTITLKAIYFGAERTAQHTQFTIRELEQLDVDGHSRHLIVVNDVCGASASHVRDACAFIDFTKYPNFDRVYFEQAPTQPFSLVYDQDAWQMMKRCVLPSNEALRGLVVSWIEAQLVGRWPVAMDAALSICCDLHSDEWLTDERRFFLKTEALSFLQACEWETPRVFWEFFRGPLPNSFDARRRTAPIVSMPP